MSSSSETLRIGVIHAVVFTFENVGDGIPRHAHGERDAHITVCGRGRVGMVLDTETVELGPGQCFYTEPGVYHAIVAREPDTRVFNVLVNPEPG